MSDVEEQNLEDMSVDDEEEMEEDDDFGAGDFDDEWFEGFLDAPKTTAEDENTETIMHLLMIGMMSKNRAQIVEDLMTKLNMGGFDALLGKLIIRYVLECPASNIEMVRRFECVAAVMRAWQGSGTHVLKAINDVLASEEPLKHVPSRNLYNFIRCSLEENAFDKRLLHIYKTRETSLIDTYVERLYKLVYDYHKMDAPGAGKPSPPSLY
uniref:MIF4G domain-containing protein n=1 Tax=Panagrellus redivivus TaxID=6233 RepID=A0A7E4VDJ6_PANRE